MSLADPYIGQLTSNGRSSEALSSLQRRIAALERGGSGVAGGTSSIVDATTLVKGKLMLAGDMGGTAALPVVKKLVNLGTTAMTDQLVVDTAHGDNQLIYGEASEGLRWAIRHGTTGSPNITDGPTVKISRLEQKNPNTVQGAGGLLSAALQIVSKGTVTTQRAVVGMTSFAQSASEETESYPLVNPDCTGIIGRGNIAGAGKGRGLGGYFEGATHSTAALPKLTAIEAQARNNGSIDSLYSVTTPADNTVGIMVQSTGTKKASCGINFALSGAQYLVGIGISSQNPIQDQSFRDDGTAATSLQINGTHATAAIGTAVGAGNVGFGTLAPTARLSLATSAMTDRVFDDLLHGGDWTAGPVAERYEIRHGSVGTPTAGDAPTFRIISWANYTGLTAASGTDNATLTVKARGSATHKIQAQAASFVAQNLSSTTRSLGFEPDAQAVSGIGEILSGGTGRAIGGFFYGKIQASAGTGAQATGVEGASWNYLTDHSVLTSGTGAGSDSMGCWLLAAGGYRSAAAMQMGAETGSRWQCGIYVGFRSGATIIEEATFRDFGQADRSIEIRGEHATAAIGILAGSGYVGIGTVSPAAALDLGWASAGVASTVAADGILFGNDTNLYRSSASVLKSDDQIFAKSFALWGTAGAGFINLVEQSSPPGTPGAAGTAHLYLEASGATSVVKLIDDAGVVVTLGAGGSGITTATDTNTIDFTVTGTDITAVIPTTATPQIATLGVGVAAGTAGSIGVSNNAAGQSSTQGAFITSTGRLNINQNSAQNAVIVYSADNTASLGNAERFRVNQNADGSVRVGFRDGAGTTNEIYKVVAANKITTSHSFEVANVLTVLGASTFTGALAAASGEMLIGSPLKLTLTDSNGYLALLEQSSAPAAPANTAARLYLDDSSGVTQFRMRGSANDRVLMRDVAMQSYTVTTSLTTFTPDRTYDADTVTLAELSTVVATLISDLQSDGQLGGSVT